MTSGQVLLVTGATGAIGFEIAAQAAATGATVGVHGSGEESVADAMIRLRKRVPDGRLIAAPADFTVSGASEALITSMSRAAGRLDALIHCASIGASRITGPIGKTDPAAFPEHAGLVLGTFQQLCFAAVPLIARQGGAIVTLASDAGRFAAPRQALVGAAFGGLMAFVRNLGVEVAREGVRVHCLAPSFVENTPVFEAYARISRRADTARAKAGLGLPSPADIAPLALFLCGPGAAKITGQVISINGGLNA